MAMSDRERETGNRATASARSRTQAVQPGRGESSSLDLDRPLPRGRHGIAPELIAEHQRQRLLDAVGACLAEHGYEALSVADLSRRAGISRVTFYKLYDDKLGCVLDAQRLVLDSLERLLARAAESGGTAAVLEALLQWAAAEPEAAQLALPCGPTFAAPAFADRALAFNERLAAQLQGDGRAPAGIYAEAAAGGLVSVIAARLAAGEAGSLPELASELLDLIVAQLRLGDREGITLAA
jgi:AcrR family transcriptional regulator